jgi:hypothetical protein
LTGIRSCRELVFPAHVAWDEATAHRDGSSAQSALAGKTCPKATFRCCALVRFTPESGSRERPAALPRCATSRHSRCLKVGPIHRGTRRLVLDSIVATPVTDLKPKIR